MFKRYKKICDIKARDLKKQLHSLFDMSSFFFQFLLIAFGMKPTTTAACTVQGIKNTG
jgi:hypothetical protein